MMQINLPQIRKELAEDYPDIAEMDNAEGFKFYQFCIQYSPSYGCTELGECVEVVAYTLLEALVLVAAHEHAGKFFNTVHWVDDYDLGLILRACVLPAQGGLVTFKGDSL
jgi:hypothetical protein